MRHPQHSLARTAEAFEELSSFEKTRKRRREVPTNAGTRHRSCKSKTRFHTLEHTKACKREHGYRAYYCALCNGWHLTKRTAE